MRNYFFLNFFIFLKNLFYIVFGYHNENFFIYDKTRHDSIHILISKIFDIALILITYISGKKNIFFFILLQKL